MRCAAATFQNRQWDGIWNARVDRSEHRLDDRDRNPVPHAELRSRQRPSWGINFQRTVRRKNEESIWMGWARNQGLNRMTNAGLLTGIQRRQRRATASTSSRTSLGTARVIPRPRQRERRHRRRTPASTSSTTRRRGLRANLTRQHRLRADRGRSAPGEPHALLAVLSREARLLSRRRDASSTSRAAPTAITRCCPSSPGASASMPATRRKSTSAESSPGRSAGTTSARCTSAPDRKTRWSARTL